MKTPKKSVKIVSLTLISLLIGVLVGVYATGSSSIPTFSTGPYAGAPSYTVYTNNSWYFAKNAYGAIEHSGTNASYLVQTIITETETKSIFFRSGDYYFDHGLTLKSGLIMSGEGSHAQRDLTNETYGTNFIYSGSGYFLSLLGTGALDGGYYLHNVYDVKLKDFRIISEVGNGVCGIYADNCSRIEIHNVRVQNFTNILPSGFGGYGILIRRSWTAVEVTHCSLVMNCYGIALNESNLIYVGNCEITKNSKTGIALIAGNGNNIEGNNVELNSEEGIWVKGGKNDHIYGNWISRSGNRGLYIANSTSSPISTEYACVVEFNHFDDNNLVSGPSQLQIYSGIENVIMSNYFINADLSISIETFACTTYIYYNPSYDTNYISDSGANSTYCQYV